MVTVNISILQVCVLTAATGCSLGPQREGWEKQTNDYGASEENSSLTVLLCLKINIHTFQKVVMMMVKEQDLHDWEACSLQD